MLNMFEQVHDCLTVAVSLNLCVSTVKLRESDEIRGAQGSASQLATTFVVL